MSRGALGERVCFIRMNYFPEEAHVRKNAEALTEAGYDVDIICLRQKGEKAREDRGRGRIYRLPLVHKRSGALRYVFEYAAFFTMAFWLVTLLHLRKRYKIIETYNVPDVIVFVALVPRLLGAKVVHYMFEATPEMYADRFDLKPGGLVERSLRWMERVSVRFAHKSIVEGPFEREMRGLRGVDVDRIAVVMNVPEGHLFQPRAQGESNGVSNGATGCEIITHGSMLKRYGVQTLIEAMPRLQREIPGLKLWVVGDGEYRQPLEDLAMSLGVANAVEFTGWVKHEEVSDYIGRCRIGIVPMLYNQLPNKLFEYVAMGLPVVVGDVPSIRTAFGPETVQYYRPGDPYELADRVLAVYRDSDAARAMAAGAQETYKKYTWDVMKEVYVGIHDEVLARGRGEPMAAEA
ncbi:MAG: glycosyltransferase [Chloroflexi bacterium]|nr:glycosyltransferase [Chloroflexota bacterium]